MRLCNNLNIFQKYISNLFRKLESSRNYIYNLLVTNNGSLADHLIKLTKLLDKLGKARLKVDTNKSNFYQLEVEYLGF